MTLSNQSFFSFVLGKTKQFKLNRRVPRRRILVSKIVWILSLYPVCKRCTHIHIRRFIDVFIVLCVHAVL